ncbi:MAG: DUF1269 domain-containing protein [Candidatus Paceibacterota bacterium]
MKNLTLGTFSAREDAEKAINQLHNELNIDHDDISFVYRNTKGDIKEVETEDVSSDTPVEGAKSGAVVGGSIGALAGIATVVGVIPVIGPIFAAGPIITALGLSGALGATAAGALTGAAAGSLIGALMNLGIGEEKAQRYVDRVNAGNILLAIYAEEEIDPAEVLIQCGAEDVETFRPAV